MHINALNELVGHCEWKEIWGRVSSLTSLLSVSVQFTNSAEISEETNLTWRSENVWKMSCNVIKWTELVCREAVWVCEMFFIFFISYLADDASSSPRSVLPRSPAVGRGRGHTGRSPACRSGASLWHSLNGRGTYRQLGERERERATVSLCRMQKWCF